MSDLHGATATPPLFETVISPHAAATPERPAVEAQGRTCSYATLESDIRRCISRLADEGPPAGAWVIVDTPDPYMFWALAFACEALGLGACASPPGPSLGPLCAALRPALLITTSAAPPPEGVRTVRIDGGFVADLARRPVAEAPARLRAPQDPVLLLSTSGTTGQLKSVVVTRHMLEVRNAQFARATVRADRRGARALALVGPWSLGGVLPAFNSWRLGGCLVSAEGLASWTGAFIGQDLDHVFLAPVHLQHLLSVLDGRRTARDMQVIVIGGTPSPRLVEHTCAALTPHVWVCYGSTETGVVSGCPLDELGGRLDTAGRIFPWVTAEVTGDDGRPAAAGSVGELRVRLDGMAHGHLGDPPDAPRSMFEGGWFRSGDLASIDDDGVLRIRGRVDDLLHVGGGKLLPAEMEGIVEPMPGVRECAAFTAPDADGLETPHLAVSPAEGFDPAEASRALAAHLGRPVRLISVDVLPRNALGKVERLKLRAAVVERGALAG